MEAVFHSLMMLMIVVWSMAVIMRKLGLPTIMGELIGGGYWTCCIRLGGT